MPFFVLTFPRIDPVLVSIGPLAIRWYALAYIAGLIFGWWSARTIAARERFWGGRPRPSAETLDDFLTYAALGVVLGGRIGYVLFYNLDFYLAHPEQILTVWQGGMAFHGGLVGCMLAMVFVARQRGLPFFSLADVTAIVAPLGLFFGRIANFINGELWGRPSDVAWAMVFPNAGPLPRHPSQLYEAGLEGVLLGGLMLLALRMGALKRPGLISGLFGIGYGIARIVSEFFREPDPQLGFLFGGTTMGMLLSIPVVLIGLVLVWRAKPLPVTAS
jgi:phosphatidylglycerol:prolipoprotein diacylglycerol transferase